MKGGTGVYPPSAARVGPMQGPTEVVLPGPGPGRVDMPRGDGAKLLVCFLGVFVCYFYYGILQESIMRGKYGEGDKMETFHFATSLVFLQCAINAAFAKLVMMLVTKPGPDHTSWSLYGACSLSYLGAMVSSNSALQFVNYPTQVLGKSCKPIPVMMLGVLLTKRRYPLTKYVCVLLIVAGVAMFMYKGQKGPDVKETGPLLGYGELLLLLSLTLDGLTGVTQDNMRIHYHTGSHAMMFYVNLCSSILLAVAAVLTGDLFELLSFSERHPGIIVNVLLFGLASAMGQALGWTLYMERQLRSDSSGNFQISNASPHPLTSRTGPCLVSPNLLFFPFSLHAHWVPHILLSSPCSFGLI